MEKVFVNISKYPSARWKEEQLNAALEYNGGAACVIDITVPAIKPEYDSNDVIDVAADIVEILPHVEKISAVSIFSDFSLSLTLASALINLGIKVVTPVFEKEGKTVFKNFREIVMLKEN